MSKPSKVDYAFSPSILDAFQRMLDTKVEDYFYQDETGAWHQNWNETEETLHYSEEEVDALLKQEFLDKVNKVPTPPSEAASKGTAFNEIVDCLVLRKKAVNPNVVIKTVRSGDDLSQTREETGLSEDGRITFDKVGKTFIYAGLDGFEFFFDKEFCLGAAEYFRNSICQYYTKSLLETQKGIVELHGYIDYLRQNMVFDCKTTRRYTFGDFQKKWQRYTYPFALIESGMMNEVSSFEFTVYVLSGGTSRTPLITGKQYKEIYTYDHEQARQMLTQQCERLAEFLEDHRDKIVNEKIFGYGISDNRQD